MVNCINNLIQKLKRALLVNLLKNSFGRSVGVLVGGAAGAQLMVVAVSPILTRLYTPQDFGLLAVYASILSIFTVIASLRYELAIPLPAERETAANIVALSLIIVVGMSVFSALFIYLFKQEIVRLFHAEDLGRLLWLLPVGVFLIGINQIFTSVAIRNKEFKLLSKVKIKQVLVSIVVQIFGFSFGALSLLAGNIASQGAGTWALARNTADGSIFKGVTYRHVMSVLKTYKQFPLYSTWSGLFNMAGSQLPALLFAALLGPMAAGLYAVAYKALISPMSVIGGAVANVFFSNAAEAYRAGKLPDIVDNVHKKLVWISIFPVVLLISAAPILFSFVFGPEWQKSGEMAQWLALLLFASFTVSPISQVFSIMDRQGLAMILQGLLLLLRVISIFLGVKTGDLISTTAYYSVANVFGYLIYVFAIFRVASIPISKLVINYLVPVACAAAVYVPISITV